MIFFKLFVILFREFMFFFLLIYYNWNNYKNYDTRDIIKLFIFQQELILNSFVIKCKKYLYISHIQGLQYRTKIWIPVFNIWTLKYTGIKTGIINKKFTSYIFTYLSCYIDLLTNNIWNPINIVLKWVDIIYFIT